MNQLPGVSAALAEKRERKEVRKNTENLRVVVGRKDLGMEAQEQTLASREEIRCMEPYSCWKKSLRCMLLWG